jgi:hypothetical protein
MDIVLVSLSICQYISTPKLRNEICNAGTIRSSNVNLVLVLSDLCNHTSHEAQIELYDISYKSLIIPTYKQLIHCKI